MNDDLRGFTTLVSHLVLLWICSGSGESITLLRSTLAKSQLRTTPPPFLLDCLCDSISCSGFVTVVYSLCLDQSAVTGEHTCMLLKPLKNDELEVNESEELGFFAPFYKGLLIL